MCKISVCMATYNGEKYIKEQLDSILCQLGKDDEVIISDDHSIDKTIKIVELYKDPRIKIFKNPEKGLIKNFENAINKSSGDYIFLSDQDDIWRNDKVEVCVQDFNNGYDLVFSDSVIFDSDSLKVTIDSFFEFYKCRKGIMYNVFFKNSYVGCCLAFKSKLKNKILPFPSKIPMHDSWIGINAEIFCKVKFNKEKLIKHRIHNNNASETGSKKGSSPLLKKIKWRFFLAIYLTINFFKKKFQNKT